MMTCWKEVKSTEGKLKNGERGSKKKETLKEGKTFKSSK